MATADAPKTAAKTTKKDWKGQGKVPSKLLHTRVSYLFQAANYLATQGAVPVQESTASQHEITPDNSLPPRENTHRSLPSVSRRLLSDLRHVALKQTIRISPEMKHSICKGCDSLLVDGDTCTTEVENKSKGGKKAWADVLVRKCNACGTLKRFPLAERQKRRPHRNSKVAPHLPTEPFGNS
jgi:ribonuclease P protein subunit RPR2